MLVGNEEDLQKGLGIPGPEVAAKSKLDPSAFFGMIDNVARNTADQDRRHYPARSSLHQSAQLGGGRVDQWQNLYVPDRRTGDVYYRVGRATATASGFIYVLLYGEAKKPP